MQWQRYSTILGASVKVTRISGKLEVGIREIDVGMCRGFERTRRAAESKPSFVNIFHFPESLGNVCRRLHHPFRRLWSLPFQ
jgi:hypothetical protein